MTTFAITRAVSAAMDRCELVHVERTPLNLDLLRAQHDAYKRALVELGCELIDLPADDELPDSVFVEDTAVVLNDFAIITRPGAASRRPEVPSVADALERFVELHHVETPGTLDGGDVLCIGKTVFVGRSGRSNVAGIDQLEEIVGERGYSLQRVDFQGCLHLKSAVTWAGGSRVLANPAWVDPSFFGDYDLIEVNPSEPAAANVVVLGDAVIHGREHPRTRQRLRTAGVRVVAVDSSEIAKAEGALTCCSVLVRG